MVAVEPQVSRGDRRPAIAFGVACHTTFVVAIAAMVLSLHEGMQIGLGRLAGASAWTANVALALSFPILHSWLLTLGGARGLDRLVSDPDARLRCTTYALVASLHLLAVFALWSPAGRVLWRAEGSARIVCELLFAASWGLLARAMYDAGLAVQTGWLGWRSVVSGRVPRFAPFPTHGLYRFTRQPVYVAFTCTLWTSPVVSTDGLLIASLWTLYCLVGPLHRESRLLAREPDRYRRYQSTVPYFLPRPRRPDGGSRCA